MRLFFKKSSRLNRDGVVQGQFVVTVFSVKRLQGQSVTQIKDRNILG